MPSSPEEDSVDLGESKTGWLSSESNGSTTSLDSGVASTKKKKKVDAPSSKNTSQLNNGHALVSLSGDGVLASSFDDDVRPLLDYVDRLHALGLEQYNQVSIPRIVIIGDQSSGKSSVVEALSGICLPRGSGIVTRAPLELRMIRTNTPFAAKLTYKKNGQEMSVDITTPDGVDKAVRDAQKDLTGDDSTISTTELRLEVHSSNVPDLTVVDLPGLVRVAVGTQNPAIIENIRDLSKSYIKQPNTITLVVCPANVEDAQIEAIKIAQEADPSGERTLGVVTKPDLANKGDEASVINRVNNQSSLRLAGTSPWIMVKCRTQQDIQDKVSLEEASKQEAQYFMTHQHYRHVDKHKRGLQTLATKLTKALIERIKTSLPDLRHQLNEAIQHLMEDLTRLGEGPPEDVIELKVFFVNVLNQFCDVLRSECLGDYHRCPNSCELLPRTREMFDALARKIEENRPDASDHLESPQGVAGNVVGASKDDALLEMMKRDMGSLRGRELLPYVKFSVFEANIRKFVRECRGPTLDCLQEVYQMIDFEFQRMAHAKLEVFPVLEARVKKIITELCKAAQDECKIALEEYINMEDMIYTQDNIYGQEVKLVAKVSKMNVDPETDGKNLTSAVNAEKIEVLSNDVGDWCTNEARKHLLNLKAYYRVASRRMMEIVPMKIQYIMLRKLSVNVQNHITGIMATTPDDHILTMGEDPKIGRLRGELQDKIFQLEKCRHTLDDWSTGATVNLGSV